MIKMPNAALEAGAKELAMNCRCELACDWRDHMGDARAAFVAMVEAWPGKDIVGYGPPFYGIDLILPLTTQENTDAEA